MNAAEISTLMNAIPMPLVLVGRDERITAANKAAETLFGPFITESHYIAVLRQPILLDCVESALKSDASARASFSRREAKRNANYRAVAEPVQGGDFTGVLLSLEDISHVYAASQMRRDFVANVSHELRSPLTALLGFIETLRGPARDDPEAQERFLGIMAREANRMSRLIQDLLSLSRVEAEERMRPTSPADVAGLVNSAAMTLNSLADENGIKLRVSGADSGIEIPGDADQLLQVFNNLIENAIKYGGTEVEVRLTLHDRDPVLREPAVRIAVSDDGEGIDRLHVPRLTERFYRVDNHRSREVGGTGLGLAIVKHIVNRHCGRLRIESEKGKGSRFVVVLPQDGQAA